MKTVPVRVAWLGEQDCRNCSIRKSALFTGLCEVNFGEIHRPIEDIMLEPHTMLYRIAERGQAIFTLRRGLIKLVKYLPDGNQRIVRLLRHSDTLGLEALVNQPYTHNAIALTHCEVCVIPTTLVEQLGHTQPQIYQELMLRWQQALTEADHWLAEFSTGTARQRVARLLLHLTSTDNEQPVLLLLGREDMGAMLGITTETVSRTIAELRRAGFIQENKPNKLITNLPQLRRIAEGLN
ncbi:MAG: Crp/Fnr family transcriptional regulator [Candidatus Contendobacter odensis]|uniref:Crp/Fnr family transcriptional regulator n=1 Tax=Candidatus Contendibacter odensensis TaxID=1400860 RepID=A0A2G6PER3_9GAMM|nr:MAG: Crp/Fnr family transcriptional regulator [Candidatus Contendobacter odensis]